MNVRLIVVITFVTLVVVALFAQRAPTTFAQSPTFEPTKRPYVFPTPIFIPTFPPDTPSPTALATQPAPTTLATPSAQPQPSDQTYTVVSGDSPWVIAQKVYGDGTKYKLILDANNLTTASRLRVGSVLTIPALPGAAPAPTATLPASIATSPTLAPTSALVRAITPTLEMTPAPAITATLTPTPSGLIPTFLVAPASTAITLLSAMLCLASLLSVVLAFLAFVRTRRFEAIESRRARITRLFKR